MPACNVLRPPETILVVDDDQDMRWALEAALASIGCRIETVGAAQRAIASVAERAFAAAFVDARLPDMDGFRLVDALRDLRPAMRIVMISGYYLEDDPRISLAMRESRIDGFLAKPFQIAAIANAARGNNGGNLRP